MSFIPNGDTVYDGTHTWNNEHDKGAYKRAFMQGTDEERLMAAALMCADPATPESMIRSNLTAPKPPRRFGYTKEEPSIDDAFADYQAPDPHSMFDFSGVSTSASPIAKNTQAVW